MKLRTLLVSSAATVMMAATVATASPVLAETIVNVTNAQNEKKTEVKLEDGDNLWQLAKDYDVSMTDIVKANNLGSINSVIMPNQELIIPGLQTTEAKEGKTTVTPAHPKATVATPVAPVVRKAAPVVHTTHTTTRPSAPAVSGGEAAAKEWIAMRESGGSYAARNGNFIGRYQLSAALLHGDYSPANQERVAHSYVYGRYGSWVGAKSFWLSHGWY